jgi:hypothetical protein
MALACKFAAMTSPNRTERKRHLDAADLIGMVEHRSRISIAVFCSVPAKWPARAVVRNS